MKKVRTDPVVDRVRKVREKLYEQFGSMDALFDHFQEMDRQREQRNRTSKRLPARAKRKTAKAPKGAEALRLTKRYAVSSSLRPNSPHTASRILNF